MGIASYKQEIDVMKNLNHPNIVRYLGTKIGKGKHKNIMYIFLEYCSGGSIRSMLTKFGSFEENLIRSYSKQILDGLLYLHSNNIIHRDIKGANLLVKDHKVKLADFGCAKIFAGLTPISNAKSILGTPFWMAPEVIRAKGYGISADIWSFGCTLIEMACGQPPWADQFTEPTAAMFHVADSTEPPKIPLNLGKDASDFILQCFKRNPKERPTAKNLLDSPWIISSDSSETKKKTKEKQSDLRTIETMKKMRKTQLINTIATTKIFFELLLIFIIYPPKFYCTYLIFCQFQNYATLQQFAKLGKDVLQTI